MRLPILAIALAMCSISSALPVDGKEGDLEKRQACNHDNVLRALLGNSAAATPFCSVYLDLPTATAYASGITATPVTSTYTVTITEVSYPSQYLPYILPTYLYSYPTPSRISSACSCLSVPETTTTYTTTSTIASTTTTTTTVSYSGSCATETPVRGAYNLSSSASDAFLFDLGGEYYSGSTYPYSAVPDCCGVCSNFSPSPYGGNDVEGIFGNCIGYVAAADGDCMLLLQGRVGAGYMGGLCSAYGQQPGTLYVDPTNYPYAAGGKGQCASTFDVVTT